MAFIRVDDHITVNTQYIVKVKWKLSPETDELSGSIFLTGGEKSEVVAIKGAAAYKLWDILHAREDLPQNKSNQPEKPTDWQKSRRSW
ncbi:MAG TPA: hypothetical protein VL134_12165 [Leptolyngbya sp.]|jgi:hypothetical protein|nr:hypothetical protein [Leptolyngbya sp.]